MDIRVTNKVALVTGATQGIGLAIARGLREAGAAGLVISGRDTGRGEAAARDLNAQFVAADLGDPSAPQGLVATCLDRFGRIDILVNAAGLTDRASVLSASPADWERLFAVNARAPFFLMQHAIAAMRAQGGGAIVNILSMNALCGLPELAIYAATKGALATLTRNAAHAHRHDRIRVNGINVGWTDTPAEHHMQSVALGRGDEWRSAAEAAMPFGRLFAPQDVANLAVFLASDAAGPMTGAVIDQEQWVAGAAP